MISDKKPPRMAAGEFKKSYYIMTPPVFRLPLLYNRRLPDLCGDIRQKKTPPRRIFRLADYDAIDCADIVWAF